ncbi:MAG: TIR domain-containing protein [Betaproteobacteria bacterium]|nr:TIR domain-containing protein [Betaproteobacteria bacterium]
MEIFISWSGERSKELAHAFQKFVRRVVQAVTPLVSEGIEKGDRWSEVIRGQLTRCRVGVICVTPDNSQNPWLLFEAGALSNQPDARVCTLLFGVEKSNLGLPLSQFQATTLIREDVFELIRTINFRLEPDRQLPLHELEDSFSTRWSDFEKEVVAIESKGFGAPEPVREERELLEEILSIVRGLARFDHSPDSESANAATTVSAIFGKKWGPDGEFLLPMLARNNLEDLEILRHLGHSPVTALERRAQQIENESTQDDRVTGKKKAPKSKI